MLGALLVVTALTRSVSFLLRNLLPFMLCVRKLVYIRYTIGYRSVSFSLKNHYLLCVLDAVLFVTALTRSVSFSLGNQYLLCVPGACCYTFGVLLGIAFSQKPLPLLAV